MSAHNTPFDIPGRDEKSSEEAKDMRRNLEHKIQATLSHRLHNWPDDQVKPAFIRVEDYADLGTEGFEMLPSICQQLKAGSELDKLADQLGALGLMMSVGEYLKNCLNSDEEQHPGRFIGQAIIELAKIEW